MEAINGDWTANQTQIIIFVLKTLTKPAMDPIKQLNGRLSTICYSLGLWVMYHIKWLIPSFTYSQLVRSSLNCKRGSPWVKVLKSISSLKMCTLSSNVGVHWVSIIHYWEEFEKNLIPWMSYLESLLWRMSGGGINSWMLY